MVARYLGDAQSGYFSVSTRIVEVFIFLPAALASSMLPGLIHSLSADMQDFRRKIQVLTDTVLFLGILVCAFLVIFAPLLIRYSFGERFLPASDALKIQGFVCIFSFLGSASQPFFIARGLTGMLLLRNIAGAVINIALNLLWIPEYGISGACFATLLSTASVHVAFNFFHRATRELIQIQGSSLIHLLNGKSLFFLLDFIQKYQRRDS
jgi:O-antigen/teichoic acid export membrane protein